MRGLSKSRTIPSRNYFADLVEQTQATLLLLLLLLLQFFFISMFLIYSMLFALFNPAERALGLTDPGHLISQKILFLTCVINSEHSVADLF